MLGILNNLIALLQDQAFQGSLCPVFPVGNAILWYVLHLIRNHHGPLCRVQLLVLESSDIFATSRKFKGMLISFILRNVYVRRRCLYGPLASMLLVSPLNSARSDV